MGILELLVLVLLVSLVVGTLPVHPYSRSWGYYPSGGIGTALIIILILLLLF